MTWVPSWYHSEPSGALHRVDTEERSPELAWTRLNRQTWGTRVGEESRPSPRGWDELVLGTSRSDLSESVYLKGNQVKVVNAKNHQRQGERPVSGPALQVSICDTEPIMPSGLSWKELSRDNPCLAIHFCGPTLTLK